MLGASGHDFETWEAKCFCVWGGLAQSRFSATPDAPMEPPPPRFRILSLVAVRKE